MVNYECQGIGHGATCGAEADVPIHSFRWDAETEQWNQTIVWVCYKHSVELRDAKNKILEKIEKGE